MTTLSTTKTVARKPETYRDILLSRPTGHLATIRPDGQLSVTPVAVMWDGALVRVSTLKSRQKYRNLSQDSRVAMSIPHRDNPQRYIEIRGTAELSDDTDRAFVNALARTYMGVAAYPFDRPGDERVVITIHPEHVSGLPPPAAVPDWP